MEERRQAIRRSFFSRTLLTAFPFFLPMTQSASATELFQWQSVENHRNFEPIRTHLQYLVDRDAKTKINRLCVIGQKRSGTYMNAYVYWPTRGKLILWEPNGDTFDDISLSRRYLDLKADVVAGNDVHGSSYLVTRAWANAVIRACRQHGKTMTIVKGDRRG